MSENAKRVAVFCAVLFVCGTAALTMSAAEGDNKIILESPDMKAGEAMPINHTQHGWDFSPALTWKNLPEGTKELALIFEGPVDAKPQPFVHWVVYNIPATAKGLPERLPMDAKLKDGPKELEGMVQGLSGWNDAGYRGPWPTSEQEYSFKVFALDAKLNLKPGLDKEGLLKAFGSHCIGVGELVVLSRRARQGSRRSSS